MKEKGKGFFFILSLVFNNILNASTDIQTYYNACGGMYPILNYTDRGSVSPSPCPVLDKEVLIEAGLQYQRLVESGNQYNLPNGELQLGLPNFFEVDVIFPNYIRQSVNQKVGFDTTSLGLKRPLWFNDSFIITLNGIITFPSGSSFFGRARTSSTLFTIANYNISDEWSLNGSLAISRLSEPYINEGKQFTALVPDFGLYWSRNRIILFTEAYGTTKTGFDDAGRLNGVGGFVYMLTKELAIDLELTKRISGKSGEWDQIYSLGLSVLFS